MVLLKEEKVSAYTHGALIPVMAAGTIVLMILAEIGRASCRERV